MRISDWSSDVCSSDLAFPKELQVRNARNFDRILKAQEKACGGPLMRFHREQILSSEYYGAARRLIYRPATQGIGQRRLPRAVWNRDGVKFYRVHGERQALEEWLAFVFVRYVFTLQAPFKSFLFFFT